MNIITRAIAIMAALFFCKEVKGQEFTVIYPSADMWLGTKSNKTAQNGSYVRIGGSKDLHFGFWKFDWNLLRKNAEVEKVHLFFYPDTKRNKNKKLVRSANLWLLTTRWDEKKTKITDTMRGYNLGSIPLDKSNGVTLDITQLYEYWVEENGPNYGLLLYPNQNSNQWYYFHSRESKHADRVRIVVYYKGSSSSSDTIPNFKLPLPGGKEWKVNTEIGDDEYLSHSGLNHYSIDIGPRSKSGSKIRDEVNVKVYAAASGVVAESTYQARTGSAQANGYYVVIDHDGDGNVNTGFQTRYLHLANSSPLRRGDRVKQGEFIGILGKTGTNEDHLHFGIRYKNSGRDSGESGDMLSKVKVEGMRLKDFEEGDYVKSTNTK